MKTVKVKDINKKFRAELKGIYHEKEISSIAFLCFQYFSKFSKADLILRSEEIIDEKYVLLYNNVIEKLKDHTPVQYIIGSKEFCDIEIAVNPNVLIPRNETEELVEWVIKENNKSIKPLKILDIGTGSGCIAIALKKNIPSADVHALDKSMDTMNTATYNALKNRTHIKYIIYDILKKTNDTELPFFDIIVSNPPYITESEKKFIKDNVLKHEPADALFVPDSKPLLFYEAIADFSLKCLKQTGTIYFEINDKFSDEVVMMLYNKGFTNIATKKDINGKKRFVRCSAV